MCQRMIWIFFHVFNECLFNLSFYEWNKLRRFYFCEPWWSYTFLSYNCSSLHFQESKVKIHSENPEKAITFVVPFFFDVISLLLYGRHNEFPINENRPRSLLHLWHMQRYYTGQIIRYQAVYMMKFLRQCEILGVNISKVFWCLKLAF